MIYTVTLNPALDRELVVPEILFDTVLRANAVRQDWGGKGFNVSRMLIQFGAASVALGFAGGYTGKALQAGLEALGIGTAFTPIAGETRTNVSLVTPDHSRHIKVNEPGPLISQSEQQALLNQIRELAKPGDYWVLAGSLPPGLPTSFYATLIQEIKETGGLVFLDASGEALYLGCQAQPYLIKPNATELAELTNRPVNSVEEALQAAKLLRGIEYLAISLGSQGAILVERDKSWFATPPVIKERNPTGAGDSMLAGLVWAFSQAPRLAPFEALRWGSACGAATAAQNGTQLGNYAQIEQLARQIEIQDLTAIFH